MTAEGIRFFSVVKALCARARGQFYESAKIRLIQRRQSITALAAGLGFDRASVSLVIHGRRKMPKVEAALRKELGL